MATYGSEQFTMESINALTHRVSLMVSLAGGPYGPYSRTVELDDRNEKYKFASSAMVRLMLEFLDITTYDALIGEITEECAIELLVRNLFRFRVPPEEKC